MKGVANLGVVSPFSPGGNQDTCIGGNKIPHVDRDGALGGPQAVLKCLKGVQARLSPGLAVAGQQGFIILPALSGKLLIKKKFTGAVRLIPQQQQQAESL